MSTTNKKSKPNNKNTTTNPLPNSNQTSKTTENNVTMNIDTTTNQDATQAAANEVTMATNTTETDTIQQQDIAIQGNNTDTDANQQQHLPIQHNADQNSSSTPNIIPTSNNTLEEQPSAQATPTQATITEVTMTTNSINIPKITEDSKTEDIQPQDVPYEPTIASLQAEILELKKTSLTEWFKTATQQEKEAQLITVTRDNINLQKRIQCMEDNSKKRKLDETTMEYNKKMISGPIDTSHHSTNLGFGINSNLGGFTINRDSSVSLEEQFTAANQILTDRVLNLEISLAEANKFATTMQTSNTYIQTSNTYMKTQYEHCVRELATLIRLLPGPQTQLGQTLSQNQRRLEDDHSLLVVTMSYAEIQTMIQEIANTRPNYDNSIPQDVVQRIGTIKNYTSMIETTLNKYQIGNTLPPIPRVLKTLLQHCKMVHNTSKNTKQIVDLIKQSKVWFQKVATALENLTPIPTSASLGFALPSTSYQSPTPSNYTSSDSNSSSSSSSSFAPFSTNKKEKEDH